MFFLPQMVIPHLPGDWAGQGALVLGGHPKRGLKFGPPIDGHLRRVMSQGFLMDSRGTGLTRLWDNSISICVNGFWFTKDQLKMCGEEETMSIHSYIPATQFLPGCFHVPWFFILKIHILEEMLQDYQAILLPSSWEPSCDIVLSCKLSRVPFLFAGKSDPWSRNILGATLKPSICWQLYTHECFPKSGLPQAQAFPCIYSSTVVDFRNPFSIKQSQNKLWWIFFWIHS